MDARINFCGCWRGGLDVEQQIYYHVYFSVTHICREYREKWDAQCNHFVFLQAITGWNNCRQIAPVSESSRKTIRCNLLEDNPTHQGKLERWNQPSIFWRFCYFCAYNTNWFWYFWWGKFCNLAWLLRAVIFQEDYLLFIHKMNEGDVGRWEDHISSTNLSSAIIF